ncbi:trace amine-associated receptor 1-like [Mya arenaria]|uniref:trace amine-associated receptor 1-like n=1 Tax=Mya arenaria TaxID=6604 RepID=UPI0022E8020C|nr:trace amine-associated receptor 1-like [Mya arenaria]
MSNTTTTTTTTTIDTLLLKCQPPTWGYEPTVFQVFGYSLSLLAVVTIVTNLVAMICIYRAPKLKTFTRLFLFSLAVCDFLVGAVVMPFRIFGMVTRSFDSLGHTFCYIGNSVDVLLCSSSMFHITILAFDRCLALCKPFRHGYICSPAKGKSVFILSWLISAVISFGFILAKLHVKGIEAIYNCVLYVTGSCQLVSNVPYAIMTTAVTFGLPSLFTIVCNQFTTRAIEKRRKIFDRLVNINTRKGSLNRRHIGTKLARTILLMSLSFLACWSPFFVIHITDPLTNYRVPQYVWTLVTWTGYANSLLNPILYLKATSFIMFR